MSFRRFSDAHLAGFLRGPGQTQIVSSASWAGIYLTTPVALKPNEAEPWLTMATNLTRKGDLDLAEGCPAPGEHRLLVFDDHA
jgi:hypothetical protein